MSKIALHEVFGVAQRVKEHSYVDRGGLDNQLRYALAAERHVAVHGASKQGKSWLRSRVLDEHAFVLVQCQIGSSIESLFTDALGALGVRAELRRTSTNDFDGTLNFGVSGSLGHGLLAKMGITGNAIAKAGENTAVESQAVGQTPGNLRWVAQTMRAAGKSLVIEDCHYLADGILKDLAFVLKALDGYGLHLLIAGIWAQDNPLTYYNGELFGRFEDIHLTWTDEELDKVLSIGSRALNMEMGVNIRRMLIADAAGNVGLLQQLAESLCRQERILERQSGFKYLTPGPSLERARHAVAGTMRRRFEMFAANFADAARRIGNTGSAAAPLLVLRGLIGFDDDELLDGVGHDELATSLRCLGATQKVVNSIDAVLADMAETQAAMAIRPPVFSYNQHTQEIALSDRSLLFFRKYGKPRWPWDGASSRDA